MGIPSYFRSILQKYPACLSSSCSSSSATTLCFDFNCLIYRCVRSPKLLGIEPEEEWEKVLLSEIVKTVLEVWRNAGKPAQVFLAVDGVVPMAKIRQQRVRRFKSAWLRAGKEGWDTNAITPGTKFMESLGRVLKGINANWIVSDVSERGEGEHKIMSWLRSHNVEGPVVVYGLDADLILLTMLVGTELGLDMFLMREKQEFGLPSLSALPVGPSGQGQDEEQIQEYQFMNIRMFQERLGIADSETLNYVALMSLMGNDFLPHSLTHKLSDGGHDIVVQEMNVLRHKGWLVVDGKYDMKVLSGIFKRMAIDEESRMFQMISKKREQARRGVGKGMSEEEGLPLKWDVESVMMGSGPNSQMSLGWREEYWKWIHPSADKARLCAEYLNGFQWILDYYTGLPINTSWMFPSWIPPLWSDLYEFTKSASTASSASASASSAIVSASVPGPTEQEQLAMVLPLESWNLIRDPKLRRLPCAAPQMWPRKFGFFSAGRKWLWECEALVPVLMVERLRELVASDTPLSVPVPLPVSVSVPVSVTATEEEQTVEQ